MPQSRRGDRSSPVEVKHLNDKAPPKPDDGLADVPQFAEKQAFDGLPEGCVHGGKLDAKFKTLAGPMDVVSAYATNEDGKGLTYKVTLANYQVGSTDIMDLWHFIEHQTTTIGHIDGEGHCETIREG